MTPFCTDTDLLHWEPALLRTASFVSQTLLAGTGNLAGTTFTISSGSFTASHVEADQTIALDGTINGCFSIMTVDSATQLTLSVLYDQLFDDNPEASPITSATGIAYAIRSFWAQRQIVSEMLMQAIGLEPDESSKIANSDALRRPCVLGTIQMIYSALAAAADDPAALIVRADLYERLYRRALRNTKVELDLDGDGYADTVRALNIVELRRT
ncbi:MAG TPA: hypothetical protein VL282_15740 [Tepidisphaeraceae bacterium]|jgi:hypothetical protein|nr:hypothetical protein [Tepidisphaeraceae bacterium]